MKKWIALLLPAFTLMAEEPKKEEKTHAYWDAHPVHVGGQGIYIGAAKASHVRGGGVDVSHGHVHFNKINSFLSVLVPVTEDTFFFPRVEYNYITFDWSTNPFFRQKHFQYLQFGLTAYTKALEAWRWIARFDYNIDPTHFDLPGPYSLYTWLLWGAHEINKQWHFHIGTVGSRGMRRTDFYPLIGIDYAPTRKWLFEAIFPINYAISYKPTDRWTAGLKVRPLKERVRAGDDEPQPRSVVRYSSMGTELTVQYEIPLRFKIELYGGVNTGGTFYIKNMHVHNALYADTGIAPYAGAALDFGF